MQDVIQDTVEAIERAAPADIPGLIHKLVRGRRFSKVMQRINADLSAADLARQGRAVAALSKLGFPTA